MTISRSEIRRAIESYDRWYQNIRFGFMLETNFSFVTWLKSLLLPGRINKDDKNRVLISNLPDLRGKRVIDIGCNSGLYSVEASCRGAAYVLGVDRSPVAIEQAKLVASIFKRMGRPVGEIEFLQVDDIQKHLELLDDKDALIAPCVLYHLGPLAEFKARVAASRISTVVLQGNTRRLANLGEYNNPASPHYEAGRQTWGNILCDVPGMSEFMADIGFRVERTIPSASCYPIVIGSRVPVAAGAGESARVATTGSA